MSSIGQKNIVEELARYLEIELQSKLQIMRLVTCVEKKEETDENEEEETGRGGGRQDSEESMETAQGATDQNDSGLYEEPDMAGYRENQDENGDQDQEVGEETGGDQETVEMGRGTRPSWPESCCILRPRAESPAYHMMELGKRGQETRV